MSWNIFKNFKFTYNLLKIIAISINSNNTKLGCCL